MYRSVIHKCDPSTNWESVIILNTWDNTGKPITVTVPYEPHLYYRPKTNEVPDIRFKTVTGKPLTKLEFKSTFKRKKWIESNPNVKIYDCYNPQIAFLRDTYTKICEDKDFIKYPLKIYAMDIETTVGDIFPEADNPTEAITCLTIADMESMNSYTWVLLLPPWKKDITPGDFVDTDKQKYFVFSEERKMYRHFFSWFSKNRPDIITGWNIDGFDIPYMVSRMKNLTSEEEVNYTFSQTGKVYETVVKPNIKARPYKSWRFEGLTILDYMQLYRDKFCIRTAVIDYKLDTVAKHELGVGKVEYNCSFKEFYEGDFKKFIEYNIIDVIRVCELDKKLKLFMLVRYMCNTALIPYEKIMSEQNVVCGALDVLMKKENKLIMTDDRKNPDTKTYPFQGGYVFAKETYLAGPFCSMDLNSLYPSIIRTINISPETVIGQIDNYYGDIWDIQIGDKIKRNVPKEVFISKFKDKVNIAPNGAIFLKESIRKGMCNKFEEKFYNARKQTKKLMLESERAAAKILKKILKMEPNFKYEDSDVVLDTDLKKEWRQKIKDAEFYFCKQWAEKTQLNSLYGLFSSKFSPICSMPCAAGITAAARLIIKTSMNFLNNYILQIDKENNI